MSFMKCEINPSTIKQPLSYVVMVILSGSFIIKINKRKKMQSHNNISESPVPLSTTLPCTVEHLHCPQPQIKANGK